MIVPTRATATASMVQALARKRLPNRKLPRQQFPMLIRNDYEKRMLVFADRMIAPYTVALQELPRMLEELANLARHDAVRADAGESKRIRALLDEARRKMNAALVNPEIERLAADFAQKTATHQRIQMNRQTRAALGVDVLASDRRVLPLMEAFVDTNVGLIRKLSDETAGRIESSVMRAVQSAKPWDEFAAELRQQYGFPETRARIIARDQIGKFYGQVNAARQRELGVEAFFWRDSSDERVRDEHELLDGKRFLYSDPPEEGLPGEPTLCRCQAEPDFSTIRALIE